MSVPEVVKLTLTSHNGCMTNYDAWLEKPYQDQYDAEVTRNLICSEDKEEGDPYCDYEGEADACVTDESSGKRWWSVTYEGECPKCGASFRQTEGDYDDSPEEYWYG
jgi:hypothetical protein